jgi:Zn-dependent metalloprotease
MRLQHSCLHHSRHSIFCVVSEEMLNKIVQNGSPAQRSAATRTVALDQTFRQMRTILTGQTPAPARRRRVLGLGAAKQRTIYTANNQETLPGIVARAEGAEPTDDMAINEAYDGLGHTFDFFWDLFNRNSIDDEGLPLSATVHYGQSYNNALWNGERMVFGDGDGDLFNRFTIALEVIAHELTHGVTEDEAGLVYMFEPGALNEHFSDVFGSLVKQRVLNQTATEADWLIGQGLLAASVQGVALRSMKAPGTAYDDPIIGKDPQPAEMRNFVKTWRDNGGVHINSGIPNRAFCLAATAIGGYAWEKAGRIWYETLRDSRFTSEMTFKQFARLTTTVAGQLYGVGSSEQSAVIEAWREVGVLRKGVS